MSPSIHGRSGTLPQRVLSVLTALALATASCTSLHQVPLVPASATQSAAWQVSPGDEVRVTLRDGTTTAFKVASVAPDAIISTDGRRFASTDIQSLKRRGYSSPKTLLLLMTLPVVVVGIGGVALWMSGCCVR